MPKQARSLTYKIALSLAIIFFIFSAGLFYINKILLPVQIKAMAVKAAQDYLKRQVSINSLQFSPIHGFVLGDVAVRQKNAPDKVFFQAKSISVNILFPALLQHKLIIPALVIDSPEISTIRMDANTWDFNDLLTPSPQTGASTPGLDVLISGFNIKNGKINITDLSLGDSFNETIHFPTLKGSLTLNGSFHVSGNLSLQTTSGTLNFDANIGLNDKSFKGNFYANNILLHHYLRFLPTPLPVSLKQLILTGTDISVLSKKDTTTVTGNITLSALDLALSDQTILQGDLNITKLYINANKSDISLQGTVISHALDITLASGLQGTINELSMPDFKAGIKDKLAQASTDINAKNLTIHLNPSQNIKTSLNIQNLNFTQTPSGFSINGNMDAPGFALTLTDTQKINGHLLLNHIAALMDKNNIQVKADAEIKSAVLSLLDVTANANIIAPKTMLAWHDQMLDATVDASFNDLVVKIKDMAAAGTPQLSLRLNISPDKKPLLTYAGTLNIPSLTLNNVPRVGTINHINGNITFENDRAQTKNISLNAFNTPVNLAGELTDFNAPKLNISAKAQDINLEILEKIIPDILKNQALSVKGTATIDMQYQGTLANIQQGKTYAVIDLANTSIDSKKLNQSVSGLNGHVEYKGTSIAWQNLTAVYQGKTWTSNGTLQNFDQPAINAFLKTENLSADIDARKDNDTLTLNALKATWFDSTLAVKGTVLMPEGKEPDVDLNTDLKLTLRDLPKMLSGATAKQIENYNFAGILKIKSHIQGTPKLWQDLTSTTQIETPAFYMMGYQVADLSVRAEQKNGSVDPLTVKGTLYGGNLTAGATVDLKTKNIPFTLSSKVENLDLEQLKKDTPLKQEQLAGLLNANANLKGQLLNINQMTGTAAFNITKGCLWKLQSVSQLLSLLSSTVTNSDIVITDASATLKIDDQKLITSDLVLKSATVSLLGEGWIGFNQSVDLNITPRVEAISTSPGTANPLDLINPTAGIVNVHMTGTLSAPKFEHNASAPQIIKKTLQNTVGSLLKIFE